jgi:hypothetical protein
MPPKKKNTTPTKTALNKIVKSYKVHAITQQEAMDQIKELVGNNLSAEVMKAVDAILEMPAEIPGEQHEID